MRKTLKKTLLCAAMTAVMGVSASASATIFSFDYNGLFTVLNGDGHVVDGFEYAHRTLISGTMIFDTDTQTGTGTITPFYFMGDTPLFLAQANDISFRAIGDGFGNPGALVLANMDFDWVGNSGIPVSLVMDAAGLLANIGGMAVGTTLGCANATTMIGPIANPMGNACSTIGGSTAATDGFIIKSKRGDVVFNGAMGTLPIVTTTWNTTTVEGAGTGSSVSGTTPLFADLIGGSPTIAGPFVGFNVNIDISQMTLAGIAAIPEPATLALFGIGLMGVAASRLRRRSVFLPRTLR